MELWYFTPLCPDAGGPFSALTQRLFAAYGGSFQLTVFAPAGAKGAGQSNGCRVLPFDEKDSELLQAALGAEFTLSYQMYRAARSEAERAGKPAALLFEFVGVAPYYSLLYQYLESDFWRGCPVFLVESPDGEKAQELPDYLLPRWWVGQQRLFCRRAASGWLPQAAGAPGADLLDQLLAQMQGAAAPPASFPFLTCRPASPLPPASSVPGLLSIIIPFYNLGATLEKTLESVFSIDYPQYEVLLIDDGSTDSASLQLLAGMKGRYPRLKVIQQENHGLAQVRNLGSRLARGEYITFLDADDLVAPDFYRRAISLLERYGNAAYVSSWLQFFDGQQGYKAYFPSCLPLLLLDNMQSAGCVCRRQVFLAYGQNCTDMRSGMEDHEAWINLAEHGYFGINIPEPLYFYRISPHSMSAQFSRDQYHSRQIRLFQLLAEKHPALYQEYSAELYQLLMANGPSYLWAGPSLPHPPLQYARQPESFWQAELALARADAENYKNSRSYRLGQALLHPLRALRGRRGTPAQGAGSTGAGRTGGSAASAAPAAEQRL